MVFKNQDLMILADRCNVRLVWYEEVINKAKRERILKANPNKTREHSYHQYNGYFSHCMGMASNYSSNYYLHQCESPAQSLKWYRNGRLINI